MGKVGAGPKLLTSNTMVAMESIRPAKMVVTLLKRRASSQLKHDAIEASISGVALGSIGFSQMANGAVQVTAAACIKQPESGIFKRFGLACTDGLPVMLIMITKMQGYEGESRDSGIFFFPAISARMPPKTHTSRKGYKCKLE